MSMLGRVEISARVYIAIAIHNLQNAWGRGYLNIAGGILKPGS